MKASIDASIDIFNRHLTVYQSILDRSKDPIIVGVLNDILDKGCALLDEIKKDDGEGKIKGNDIKYYENALNAAIECLKNPLEAGNIRKKFTNELPGKYKHLGKLLYTFAGTCLFVGLIIGVIAISVGSGVLTPLLIAGISVYGTGFLSMVADCLNLFSPSSGPHREMEHFLDIVITNAGVLDGGGINEEVTAALLKASILVEHVSSLKKEDDSPVASDGIQIVSEDTLEVQSM